MRGRVLLVTSNFPRWPGDTTTPFILHLAEDLQRLDWDIHVLAPHFPGARRSERIDGVAVRRFRYVFPESAQTLCYNGGALINLRNRKSEIAKIPLFVAAEMAGVVREVVGRRYDLIHSHWILPQGFTAGLVARTMGIPHVTTVHGGDVFALQGRLLREFKRAALSLADAITVNSSATERAVTEIGHGEVPVIRLPMGANVQTDRESAEDFRSTLPRGAGPLVIFIGRLIHEKGVADFLHALVEVRSHELDATGLIVGDGPARTEFEALSEQLGLGGAVRFMGWMPSGSIGPLLQASDVFVAPSKPSPAGWVEAQGLTIVEAMLAGVPVIATSTGGVADLVKDGQTGLLIPPASPALLAQAVRRIWENPILSREIVENARSVAERHYTRSACAQKFTELFENTIRLRLRS